MTLQVDKLSCQRHERLLFHDLHFQVSPGELWQVTGHNGAGKTSLLRILCGLLQPHTGKITWQNKSILHNADYRDELFYVGHTLALREECTVMENILLFFNCLPNKERIHDVLD